MNRCVFSGRVTGQPRISRMKNESNTRVARYTLAVQRYWNLKKNVEVQQNENPKTEGQKGDVDYIRCVAFGKNAEFVEKYLFRGIKIGVEGKLRTGRYRHKDSGEWIYTTELVVDRHEFAEAKEKNDAMRKALAFEDDDSSVVDITYPEDFEDFD